MTDKDTNHHRLEVESMTARAVASNILSTMDVDPTDVVSFEVQIEAGDDRENETLINSDGPKAGQLVSPMLQAVDWDDYEPRRIEVNVHTENGTIEEPTGDQEGADDVDAHVVDEVEIAPLTVGTNAHIGLTAAAAYIWKESTGGGGGRAESIDWTPEKPGITVGMIYDTVDVELTRRQLTDAIDYCRDRGLMENVGSDGEGTNNYYHLNQDGWLALRASGASDEVEDFPLDELLAERVSPDGSLAEGYTYEDRDRGEFAREEPDVDEPRQISPNTHTHHALTILEWIAEEYGDDHWVSAEGVYEYPADTSWANRTSASTCLSTMFLQHALCERRKEPVKGNGGVRCVYRINKAGRGELNRIGEADI